MHRTFTVRLCRGLLCLCLSLSAYAKPKSLEIYFIDVEGGQSTLIVSPSGESVLIDAGWPDENGRDADRILQAAHVAKIKQIDYLLVTHYHQDHVGGVPQLAKAIKIGTFGDHGPNQEDSENSRQNYAEYQKVFSKAQHLVLKPGDGIPIKDVTVRVLTAAGEQIRGPLPGKGEGNSLCASEPAAPDDPSENARSLGVLVIYGKFRFLDLGDLTKKKELELVCPNNLLGTVDLYLTTHHGGATSNPKALVQALSPRVAIMNNGAHKGGDAEAWQIVHDSPNLEAMWQLHYAVAGGKSHNVDEAQIANIEGGSDGNFLKVSAMPDAKFTVFNSRTGKSKTYRLK